MTTKEFEVQLALGTAPSHEQHHFEQLDNTPTEILDRLAASEYHFVRWAVACNCNTSNRTLIELSKDPSVVISRSAAYFQQLKKVNMTNSVELIDLTENVR